MEISEEQPEQLARRANRGFRENQEKTEKRGQEVIPDQLDHKGRQEKMRMQ